MLTRSPRCCGEFAAIVASGDGKAVIGVDLKKPVSILLRPYAGPEGVTAAFSKKLLARINRELGGTFLPRDFAYEARWNPHEAAVEMHTWSVCARRS
jgi:uncharacterized SAM-dependent methyltransferase